MSKAKRNRNKHNNKAFREHVMGFSIEQCDALNRHIAKQREDEYGVPAFVGDIESIMALMAERGFATTPQA